MKTSKTTPPGKFSSITFTSKYSIFKIYNETSDFPILLDEEKQTINFSLDDNSLLKYTDMEKLAQKYATEHNLTFVKKITAKNRITTSCIVSEDHSMDIFVFKNLLSYEKNMPDFLQQFDSFKAFKKLDYWHISETPEIINYKIINHEICVIVRPRFVINNELKTVELRLKCLQFKVTYPKVIAEKRKKYNKISDEFVLEMSLLLKTNDEIVIEI